MSRKEPEIRNEIEQLKTAAAFSPRDEVLQRRCAARIQECRKELRELDDTPVIPFRPSSVPPSRGPSPIPSGRPIPRAPRVPRG